MLSCSFGYIVDSSSEFHFVLDSLGDIFSKESILDVLFMHSLSIKFLNRPLPLQVNVILCVSANDILTRLAS